MVKTVLVAVRAESYVYDRPYSYFIPASETHPVAAGMRVLVPFGRGNRLVQALILSCRADDTAEGKKPVGQFVDDEPIVSEKEIRLILWMRDKYFCTCYDVFRLFIPAGSDIRQEIWYAENPAYRGKPLAEDSEAMPLMLYIRTRGDRVSLAELTKTFGEEGLDERLNELMKRKMLRSEQHALLHNPDKTVTCARLCEDASPRKKLTKQQAAAIDFLRSAGEASLKDITYYLSLIHI